MPKTLKRDELGTPDQVDCLARLKLEDCFCSGFSEACRRARGMLCYAGLRETCTFSEFGGKTRRAEGRTHGPIQFEMIAISAPGIRKKKQPGQKLQ